MTSWAMVSRAGNGRRTDRSQSLVRLSEDIGRGGVGSGGAAAGELPVRSPFRRYPHREPRSLHGGGHRCIT